MFPTQYSGLTVPLRLLVLGLVLVSVLVCLYKAQKDHWVKIYSQARAIVWFGLVNQSFA